MNVLVTGGAGYIGTHTVVELLAAGHEVVIVDNFSNSSPKVLKRLEKIVGQKVPFYEVDVRDQNQLDKIFSQNAFDAAIHFAGLKAVGESVAKPLEYYRNNIDSSLALLEIMQKHRVQKLVFSSSATVYGQPQQLPLAETHPTGQNIPNPYGQTKYMIEQILRDTAAASKAWQIIALRYFNPIGAHESGLIGEDPVGIPNNLMPFVAQVAVGQRDHLSVFGDNWDTADGTGVRDYIHVVDLAKGHVAALDHIDKQTGFEAINLGTGRGTSVLELVKAFEQASGQKVPYKIIERRPGDVAACYADASKAKQELGWQANKTIEDACRDSWHWQSKNPDGYL